MENELTLHHVVHEVHETAAESPVTGSSVCMNLANDQVLGNTSVSQGFAGRADAQQEEKATVRVSGDNPLRHSDLLFSLLQWYSSDPEDRCKAVSDRDHVEAEERNLRYPADDRGLGLCNHRFHPRRCADRHSDRGLPFEVLFEESL